MALDDEGMLVLLLDYACVDQVAHEDGRGPVVLRLLLRLSQASLTLDSEPLRERWGPGGGS